MNQHIFITRARSSNLWAYSWGRTRQIKSQIENWVQRKYVYTTNDIKNIECTQSIWFFFLFTHHCDGQTYETVETFDRIHLALTIPSSSIQTCTRSETIPMLYYIPSFHFSLIVICPIVNVRKHEYNSYELLYKRRYDYIMSAIKLYLSMITHGHDDVENDVPIVAIAWYDQIY